jgi:hypothetical protein
MQAERIPTVKSLLDFSELWRWVSIVWWHLFQDRRGPDQDARTELRIRVDWIRVVPIRQAILEKPGIIAF